MDHSWYKRYHALRWKSVTYFAERAGRPECLLLKATDVQQPLDVIGSAIRGSSKNRLRHYADAHEESSKNSEAMNDEQVMTNADAPTFAQFTN